MIARFDRWRCDHHVVSKRQTLVTSHPVTQHHITEERKAQPLDCWIYIFGNARIAEGFCRLHSFLFMSQSLQTFKKKKKSAGWKMRISDFVEICFEIFLVPINIQGGAEPTDTFRIWILRRRDSLSWLAGSGTVEERTPFHMVRNSMAVVREMFGTVISRFGDIAWPARSPNFTVPDFFLWGLLKDLCVLEAHHDYSRTQTRHCWRSCGYWWGPTEARVR